MVSIIVPVYNVEKFIEATVNSVLSQTYTDFELLLVDDCSTDKTLEIINRFSDNRIRLIKMEDNLGAWAARNRGLKEAKGELIAFLDSDDLWVPEKLEKEICFMKAEDAGFVFTGYEFADSDGVGLGKIVRVPHTLSYKEALRNTTIFTSTVLIDRRKISDSLIEMPNIKSEDTATWWNILKAGNVAYGFDENLVKYRRSAGSLSSNKFAAIERIWRLYREIAGLSVIKASFCFVGWAFNAVMRRI